MNRLQSKILLLLGLLFLTSAAYPDEQIYPGNDAYIKEHKHMLRTIESEVSHREKIAAFKSIKARMSEMDFSKIKVYHRLYGDQNLGLIREIRPKALQRLQAQIDFSKAYIQASKYFKEYDTIASNHLIPFLTECNENDKRSCVNVKRGLKLSFATLENLKKAYKKIEYIYENELDLTIYTRQGQDEDRETLKRHMNYYQSEKNALESIEATIAKHMETETI